MGSKTDDQREYEAGNETGDETDYETDYETGDERDDKKPDTRDMPALESEEYVEQKRKKQKGQGLKISTPDQMLSRLPITLAQLKAGNNSEKLKNEIGQQLHSLYRSKKLTETIYNNLINTIQKMETNFMNTENSKTNLDLDLD